MEAIAIKKMEAITVRWEAIAVRLEANAIGLGWRPSTLYRLEAIAIMLANAWRYLQSFSPTQSGISSMRDRKKPVKTLPQPPHSNAKQQFWKTKHIYIYTCEQVGTTMYIYIIPRANSGHTQVAVVGCATVRV